MVKKVIKYVIIIGVLFNLLFLAGGMVYSKYNIGAENFNKLLMLYQMADLAEKASNGSANTDQTTGPNSAHQPGNSGNAPQNPTGDASGGTPLPGNLEELTPAEQEQVITNINEQISKPIEKKDMLSVGVVLMRKLSRDEINWLYQVGTSGNPKAEDLKKAKDLLQTRLSNDELKSFEAMAAKYGKNVKLN